jgi:type IV pilus assembly protein PilF
MRAVVALLAAALLAACAQTTTVTTSVPSADPRPPSDPVADADRRARTRLELAGLYFGRRQYDVALDEIKLALAAKPDLGAAFNLRGLIYSAMGDDALADENFARALALNPRDADAMHNRAWFWCQRNRFDEADRLFEQAIAIPQYRDAVRSLLAQGVCNARSGKLLEAEGRLTRAYEADPTNPTIALNLAEVLYRRADYERARFYIRRVNAREELTNAQTLWLAMRIENRFGNRGTVDEYGRQLRNRFPQSPEALSYDRGRFDE